MFVGLLAPSAFPQLIEDPSAKFDERQALLDPDAPGATRFRLKYPHELGPEDENPYVIQEPLYPEQQRGSNVNTSLASSRGLTTGASAVAPSAMTGPGAILSGRGSGSARSSHQDARRALKKVIRQLD
jgi:hypothetical protein